MLTAAGGQNRPVAKTQARYELDVFTVAGLQPAPRMGVRPAARSPVFAVGLIPRPYLGIGGTSGDGPVQVLTATFVGQTGTQQIRDERRVDARLGERV